MQLNLHRFAEVRTITTKLTVDSKEAVANIKKISTGVKAVTTELHNMSVGMKTGADEKQLEKYGNRLDYLKKRISTMRTELEKSYGTKGYDKVVKDLTNIEKEYNKVLNLHKTGGLDLSVSPSGMSSSIKQLQFLRNTITAIQNINREKGLSFDTSALKETGVFQTLPQSLQDILTKIESINNATEKNPEVVKKITNSLKDNENALKKVSAAEKALTDAENQNTNANNNNNNSHKKNQNTLNKYPNLLKTVRKGFQGLTLVRLNYLFNTVRRGSGIVKEMVTTAADYQESLNLYNAALGSYADEATKWADELTNKLFIDPSAIRQYTGTFYNLSKGLGVAREDAFLMSKTLTQLTYDMSSYLNIDIESANEKLISAMSGQARAIQGVGVAIQLASLETTAQQLGIQKSVSEMTQAEKTYLRYIQLMKSTKQMQGDLGATLNTPTNALRAFQAEVKQLARAFGNVLIPIMAKILPWIMAITELLQEAAQALAEWVGFKPAEVNYEGLEWGADALEDYGDAAEAAGKKIKNSLAPFDELNVVSSSSGGGGSGGAGGSVLNDLAKNIEGYDMLSRYSDGLKGKVEEIKETLRGLIPIAETIAGVIAAYKVFETIGRIGDTLANFAKNPVSQFLAGATLAVGGFLALKDAIERTGSELEAFIGRLGLIGGGTLMGTAIGQLKIFGEQGPLIGGAIGAITGTIVGLITEIQNLNTQPFDSFGANLTRDRQEVLDYLDSLKVDFGDIKKQYDDSLGKIANDESYVNKLKEITDGTGHVKKGNEDLAQHIITHLNEGYGTHMRLINGVIEGYKKEIKAIEDLIVQQKLEVYNQLGTEAYEKAIKNKGELSQKVGELTQQIDDQNQVVAEAQTVYDEYLKYHDLLNKDAQTAGHLTKEEREELEDLQDTYGTYTNKTLHEYETALIQANTKLGVLNEELETAEDNYNSNADVINSYDDLLVNVANKNVDGTIAALDRMQHSSNDTGKDIIKDVSYYMAQADIEYKKAVKDAKENGEEWTADREFEASRGYRIYAGYLADRLKSTDDITPDMVKAWGKLANESETGFIDGLNKLDDNTRAVLVKTMQDAGYKLPESVQQGIDTSNVQPKVEVVAKLNTSLADKAISAWEKGLTIIKEASIKVKANGGMYVNGIWKPVTAYASGGTPDTGQMFIAREAGPELVGRIGNNTAVVNNDQIVASVAKGVYDAVVAANSGNNQPHTTNVYVGNEKLYSGQGEYQNREADRYGTSTIVI